MHLLLSAIGATAAALLEVGVGPYLSVGDAHLHPVLVIGVIWTIAAGLDGGVVWAMVGGIVLDILLQRPLGASSLSLLVMIGAAHLASTSLLRIRGLAPVLAVPVLSLGYSLVLYALVSGVRQAATPGSTVPILLPGVVFDTVLAVVIGPLAVSLHDRRIAEERVDW